MAEALTISKIELTDEGSSMRLDVTVHSVSERTLHVYREARNIKYDAATKTLTVGMHDHVASDSSDSGGSLFQLPRFAAVDPLGDLVISVKLPRFITRINGATPQGAPNIEQVPIHEATSVQVELAWSDTPFYPDNRRSARDQTTAQQLSAWATGLAKAAVEIQLPRPIAER